MLGILPLLLLYQAIAFTDGLKINHISALSSRPILHRSFTSLPATFVLNPTIAGGILSGSLHSVTGPDHLAALLPPSVGKPGLFGAQIGAAWGLGHGISAMMLGLFGFFVKGRISSKFSALQNIQETVVGISLLAIGLIGIKENLSEELDPTIESPLKSSGAIFANGFLHGFSWDGAPSLAPAIAMRSWQAAFSFLLAYCVGTIITMSATAGLMGALSTRVGKALNSPRLSKNLSLGSSLVAVLVGVFWTYRAISK